MQENCVIMCYIWLIYTEADYSGSGTTGSEKVHRPVSYLKLVASLRGIKGKNPRLLTFLLSLGRYL